MGANEVGARVFLQRVAKGEITRLPEGVTRSTLERYIIRLLTQARKRPGPLCTR